MSDLPAGFEIIGEEVPDVPPGFTPVLPEVTPSPTIDTTTTPVDMAEEVPQPPVSVGEELAAIALGGLESGRENVLERRNEAKQTLFDYLRGDISQGEATLQALGKWQAGTLIDLAGDAFTTGARGFSVLVPDSLEDPVKEKLKAGWDWLTGTEAGQLAAEVASEGMEEYDEWKGDNPQDAKTLESIVNIAAVAVPGPKAKPVTQSIDKAADTLDKLALIQVKGEKAKYVHDLLTPVHTKKQRMEQVTRTRQTGGKLTAKNIPKPTTREVAAIREVNNLPVDPKKSYQFNYNVISDENTKLAKRLEARLSAKRDVKIQRGLANNRIDSDMLDWVSGNPVLVGKAETTATRVADKAKELLGANPNTPLGVLTARKQFDQYVKGLKGDAVFDPNLDNALTGAVRTVRQSINNIIDEAVPSAGVKDLLRKQTRLYDALDIVQPKAAEEAATAIGRAFQNAIRVTRAKAELNRDAAILLGVGAYGAATQISPWVLGGVAIAGAGTAAVKGAMSPNMKKGLSYILKQTNKAIKMTKQPEMLKQLTADRLVLTDLLQNTMEEEE